MQLPRASPLVISLLVAGGSALRTAIPQRRRDAGDSTGQTCAPEPPQYSGQDLPRVLTPSLLRARSAEELQREEDIMTEYMHNLSHVRPCSSMKDKVGYLQPLIVPQLKLAFCFIPKVACTQFKDLFNRLNELDSIEGFGTLNYVDSMPRKLRFPLANVSRENGWKFVAFTRDPALRYLSAWGSTCVSMSRNGFFEHEFECCGPTVFDNTVDRDTVISMFEARVMSDLRDGVVKRECHWVAQVEILKQCNWDLFNPGSLDFHGHLHLDMNSQVKAMLRMVDHSDDPLVDRLFPSGRINGHRSPLHHLKPEDFYRNKQILEAVKEIYEDDYWAFENIGCPFTEPTLAQLRSEEGGGRQGLQRLLPHAAGAAQ